MIACVILAAGLGRRFGTPKAGALTADGSRFLDVIAALALGASLAPVIAVVPPRFTVDPGVLPIVNADGGGEQITSLRLGLEALGGQVVGALLWPVDHPFVSAATVTRLRDLAIEQRPVAAVPVHRARRGHPAYVSREVWPALRNVRDGGARAVIHALGSSLVEAPVDDPGVLADVDTREALAFWSANQSIEG